MPRRTNEFQQLVILIQNALAPQGAKVTESAEFKVDGLDTVREVDVLIEGEFGPFRMKVAVEARDENRRFSLQDFDSLWAKYRGECRVQIDKFAVVTRRGFTKGVLEKARKLGVALLTLDEAKARDWSQEVPSVLQFRFPPHVCTLSVEPHIENVHAEQLKEARLICACCGKDHGTLMRYVEKTVFQHILPRQPELVHRLDQEAECQPNGQALLTLEWNTKNRLVCRQSSIDGWRSRTRQSSGRARSLATSATRQSKIDESLVRLQNRDHPFDKIVVGVHSISAKGNISSCEYELTSTEGDRRSFSFLDATAGGKRFRFLMPDGFKSKRIVVRIDPASAKPSRNVAVS
jgi:hypothetical protein